MALADIVLLFIGVFVSFELLIILAVHLLRKRCQWLLTRADVSPEIDETVWKSFIESSWDSELGWIRRASSSKTETGKDGTVSRFHIDETGSRVNPGFENVPASVFVYGDSYAFARQVNDEQTWSHHLSNSLKTNVANRGVGNYGIDQALIRLERETEAHRCDLLIMAVVPETIGRIHSVWKHYSEYGNTLAFKPRYIPDGQGLRLFPNLLDTAEKFERISEFGIAAREHDYFFQRKFMRDLFRFPYSLCLWRENSRNLKLIYAAFLDLFDQGERAFVSVMRRNIELSASMFNDPDTAYLLKSIILRFRDFAKSKDIVPLFIMMPQMMDLERVKEHGPYYDTFMRDISEHIDTIDLTEVLLDVSSPNDMYIHDVYGGHFSAEGNQFVADQITPVCKRLLNR